MSSPEEEQFVKDSFAEISEIDKAKLDVDERVKNILSSQEVQIGSVTFGGTEIKFRTYLSKSLRHSISKVRSHIDDSIDENTIALVERTMYDVLGQLCTEDPFNHWETWAYIDEKSTKGGVQGIFIAKAVEDVKSFRNKQ
jgi:hypothetical protein